MQMKIVFNVFKSISPKILDPEKFSSQIGDFQGYEYQLLLPLYKVCEGCAGKVVPGEFWYSMHLISLCARARDLGPPGSCSFFQTLRL